MSINGNWLRVTPAELARAKDDLDWAEEFVQAAVAAEDERLCGTDKAWQAFEFLLERRGFDIEIAYGAESFVETPDLDPDDEEFVEPEVDWGYGPPRYLTPEQVATAATELAGLTEDDLIRGVDPAELTRAQIYPDVWDRPDELRWVTHHLPYVQDYFAAAAKDGDAIICWLD
ncbi:YfbM family protein [Plantactinospora soyae]|uniref:DUF1877 family protein n=1 Tax=Plantactinospora soyae TaxID=1544732 RepID=A0A927R440_9ACTN|nr:YfbM family protein [Plantactinospora soyae]MBE1486179.1 hypothetical protein [Plantactinospora soyae]